MTERCRSGRRRVAIGVLLLAAAGARAGQYYVSAAQGDDQRSEAEAKNPDTPWASPARAARSVQAGDTVIVKAGVYTGGVTVVASGTAENPIVFRAEGEAVFRDIRELPRELARVGGLPDVWSTPDPGPVAAVFENPGTCPALIDRYSPVAGLEGLKESLGGPAFFHDRAKGMLYLKPFAPPLEPAGKKLVLSRLHTALVAQGSYIAFEGFRIEFAISAVRLEGPHNAARRLRIYHCGDGIHAGGESSAVEFCIVRDCGSGIGAGPDCAIRHNTVFGTRATGLGIPANATGVIANNIIVAGGVSGLAMSVDANLKGGLILDYNLWQKHTNKARNRFGVQWGATGLASLDELRQKGYGLHSLQVAPLFVDNPADVFDLRLQTRAAGYPADSPCIGAGLTPGTDLGALPASTPEPPGVRAEAAGKLGAGEPRGPKPAPSTAVRDPIDPARHPAWSNLLPTNGAPGIRAVAIVGQTPWILCDQGLLEIADGGTAQERVASNRTAGAQAFAVDADAIWIGGSNRVLRIARGNGAERPWAPAGLPATFEHVLFDGRGGIYVYEASPARLSAFDVAGKLLWRVARIYDLPATLATPLAVARADSGSIYVADGENNRICKFTADGQFIGRVPDVFCRPHGLAILPAGRLAVLSDYTERIDAPLLTILDADDAPVADWVSDALVVKVERPVFHSYSLGYYQAMGDHPPRPPESISPLNGIACRAGALLVGQTQAGCLRVISLDSFGPRAAYPARTRQALTKTLKSSRASYAVPVGGTLDWRNTTRSSTHSGYMKTPLFMADDSYTIRNDGNVPVVNPHVSINGKGDYFSAEHIRRAIIPPGARYNNLEKAFAVYNFVRSNLNGVNWVGSGVGLQSKYYVFDWWGIKEQEIHLTSKWNNFGAPGACGCYSAYVAKLAHDFGLPARNGGVVGHCPSFVMVDGREVYLDAIMAHSYRDPITGIFCPTIDNQGYAGYADIVNDQYLIMRVAEWPADLGVTPCFGKKEQHKLDPYDVVPKWVSHRDTSRMALTLRPGEAITRRTAYLGRSAIEPALQMDAVVNGDIVYRPRLADGTYRHGAIEEHGLAVRDGALVTTNAAAAIAFSMACPHPLLNGVVTLEYERAGADDALELDLNVENQGWQRIWQASRTGRSTEAIYLWPLDRMRDTDANEFETPPFSYAIRIRMQSARGQAIHVHGVAISSLFQTFYQTLPRLEVGQNRVAYEDETAGRHQVTLTHRWKESAFGAEPEPPPAPVFPADGATVKGYEFTFRWEPGKDLQGGKIGDYEWEASQRPDFMWPVAPNFSMYTRGKTEEPVPDYSLLSTDTIYYWHVRCRSDRGVWGPWSKTWTFRCVGPRVPLEPAIRQDGRRWILSWKPNPAGTRPVKYEVFADNIQGFVPIVTKRICYVEDTRKQYDKPGNIILTTDQTEAVVVAGGLKDGDRCYFRVAAIDANGNRGGPSAYVAARHPFILADPAVEAKVGAAFQYRVRSLMSLGEMSLSGATFTYPHRATLTFALKAGPAWLKLDPGTGILSGTPSAPGTNNVSVEVTDGRGGSDRQDVALDVKP